MDGAPDHLRGHAPNFPAHMNGNKPDPSRYEFKGRTVTNRMADFSTGSADTGTPEHSEE